MIKLKSLLNESMNLHVKGADYDKTTDLLSICTKLFRILDRVYSEMPKDQQEYFKKNRVMETFAPDGDDFDKSEGTINFYIAGLTKNTILKILKLVIHKLKSLNIKIGKISKREQSGVYKSEVIRIPIIKNENVYNGPPELNLSNRNAYHIFHNILGFQPDDEYGSSFSFTVDELENSINTILNNDPDWIKNNQIGQNEIDPENPHNAIGGYFQDLGMKVVSGGYSSDDIKYRLDIIKDICQWAKSNGYKELYVN